MVHVREAKHFNFQSQPDATLKIDPSSIPTLVPSEALDAFGFKDDPAPYFKAEVIDFPTLANGFTYTEDFWKSFVNVLNTRPIPGSARGHDTRFGARAPTDLLLIGGKVESAGGGAGRVLLKNWLMPIGESGDNQVFIAAAKAGMLDFSIVTFTKDEISTLPDGTVQRLVMESIGGERNDALDRGTGAMRAQMNAEQDPEPEYEPAQERSGVTVEDFGPPVEREVPEILVGATGKPQDPGDGIPTFVIGGSK